ncbi:MAG: diacylglycerol kinase family lipid kinase [Candidatus Hydrogenedentes bacterium]|nr:diacylglycerol kinase family lipid kinase [Candidatus Hydrogenedentota bacterium]
MHVIIIANPVSGGGQGRAQADRLKHALEQHGATVELRTTAKAGDAHEFARQAQADAIAVVGGDGTLNEVLNGLDRFTGFLAPLPMGTANVVARELRLPRHPEQLAGLIMQRQARFMDVGRCEDRLFLLGAGAGLDAAITEITQQTRHGRKSTLRMWVMPAVRVVFNRHWPTTRVVVDGVLLCEASPYTIVGICRYSAGVFPATPAAKIDDGLFDVCCFTRLSLWRIALTLLVVYTPLFIRLPWVTHVQGHTVELTPEIDARVPLQIDGDPAGELPARFAIEARAIQIITGIPEL